MQLIITLLPLLVAYNAYRIPLFRPQVMLSRMAALPDEILGRNDVTGTNAQDVSSMMLSPNQPILIETTEEDKIVGMPDRTKFSEFYKRVVKSGKEMRLDQFMRYEEVAALLDDEVVFPDDINDLWISTVGDASGLTEDEAYEMLCMVGDLPEPQDEAFLDKEFEKLTDGKGVLKFQKFLGWDDVQGIIEEEALTVEQITGLWRLTAGDLNKSIDRVQFGKLNIALDKALDEAEDGEDVEGEDDDEDDDIDLTGVDIWDPSFDAKEVFDDDSLQDVTAFYNKAAGLKGLTLEDILEWSDVQAMLDEKLITKQQVQSIWKEGSQGKKTIDLDTFIRFTLKLDLLIEEAEEETSMNGVEDEANEDAEKFYRNEFRKLTGGGRLLRLDMLLDWSEVSELIEEGTLSRKQVRKMFEGLPQQPMGIPSDQFGITEDTFVAFNGMLDLLMDATGSGESGQANIPASLVSSAPRPMPNVKELTIGSLGQTSQSDDGSTGLSPSELEIMETLDKADNMLNSGSYSDFDKLIGDINDPRLAALREKDLNAASISGGLNDILKELLTSARAIGRCGLDKPSDEDAARMRDLISAVIEQSPRAATRSLPDLYNAVNGKWKLLYTNSEMFDFYKGVTGFVNVFPASKFVSLSTEYSSDGVLAEAKFFETLSSPLGQVVATVFSTWEMVKEMSFMTNENSVVLRSYCSKVTAGPMEYLAEENWKSLRIMSMNELVYVDDKIRIMRNCGALRIFFVYERE